MKTKILLVLFILIVLVFGMGITYSIFHSNANLVSIDQGIAKFIFNDESINQLQLSLTGFNPGDVEEYLFSVSNSSLEEVSDVTVEYQMTIKTYHLVPLTINLYKIEGEIDVLILTCDETYTRNDNNELVCNAPLQELGHSISDLDEYKLIVEFPSEYNDESYANLVDYLEIEIRSWQKIGN